MGFFNKPVVKEISVVEIDTKNFKIKKQEDGRVMLMKKKKYGNDYMYCEQSDLSELAEIVNAARCKF